LSVPKANNFEIRGKLLLEEPLTQRISLTVEQIPMTVKALVIRALPPLLTFQGLIKSMAILDHGGMAVSFLVGRVEG
jgi:hypothetical protein